jgi:hypothetical protein
MLRLCAHECWLLAVEEILDVGEVARFYEVRQSEQSAPPCCHASGKYSDL